MTPVQIQQFTDFGCISRSIMLLASAKQRQVTRDDFCLQFQHLFIIPNQYGGLYTSQIVDVLRGLGLGDNFQTIRKYGEIKDAFNNSRLSVLVSSEINLNAGASDIIRHCSLLTRMESTWFSITTPSRDGRNYPLDFKASDWDAKLCHGIVIL